MGAYSAMLKALPRMRVGQWRLVLVEPHQRIKLIFTKIESTIEN
jgi:hypothetical protein